LPPRVETKKLKSENNELEQLKKLLLEPELKKLRELESRLNALTLRSEDEGYLKERLLPLFDEVFLERLRSSDEQTITILSQYLARIVSKTSEIDPESFKRSLQSVLAPAIKEEIASNKDAMIDALYPIMGGMIGKYVTSAIHELMESINKKINEGFSLRRIKRKIKAKLTGVSETELLLEESTQAVISSLFVIHKESGMLISEAHLNDEEIDDPHMIASMASAVKDFINDWIKNKDELEEVQLLSYGKSTLYIESAGSVYLIAFMSAEPDREQRMEINRFFASIVKRYSLFFQEFDGDDSHEEVQALSRELEHYLREQRDSTGAEEEISRSNTARYVLAALLIALLIPLAYWLKNRYLEYTLTHEVQERTGTPIEIRISHGTVVASGVADSFSTHEAIDRILQKSSPVPYTDRITISAAALEKLYTAKTLDARNSLERLSRRLRKVSDEIVRLKQTLREKEKTIDQIRKRLDDQQEALHKADRKLKDQKRKLADLSERNRRIAALNKLKSRIDRQLEKRLDKNPYFRRRDHALVFSGSRFLPKGKDRLNPASRKIIAQNLERYLSAVLSIPESKNLLKKITVSGYTDSDGGFEYNMRLSSQRAESVAKIIENLGIVRKNGLAKLIEAKGYGDRHPIIIDGVEDKEASRRVVIRYVLDRKKIDDTLKKLLQKNVD